MKRKAAARSVAPIINCGIIASMSVSQPFLRVAGLGVAVFCVVGFVSAGLEHREHAIGDRIAAGGIAGAEQHGKEADRLLQHRARIEQSEHPADHDDAVHKVGARHQRRMQDRRHAADDHPAGKAGEHEDVQGHEAGHRYLEFHRDLTPDPPVQAGRGQRYEFF